MSEETSHGVDLSPVAEKFILHWGELGMRWGISRSVAQIHALLYLSPKPLDFQTIATTLGIARSNASTSLRELEAWGVVRSVHVLGDRRQHFEAIADVWHMLSILAEARKRREVDPTLAILRECAAESKVRGSTTDRFIEKRIHAMLDVFEALSPLVDEFARLPTAAIRGIAGLQGRLRSIFRVVK
ncbi:MAG TPA: MarR family transcriptional regulator [Candidatus Baltobacteraceae bacterium]|jgi:DNA-binding transcriptional regulator GbsR (MarR family)|nr:MarR family transcriptional regulator [Candidatus Baltobacteraceae bacterium]